MPTDSFLVPPWRPWRCSLLALALLGCPAASEGDDLPPGAFTTGGEPVDPADTSSSTTTTEPGDASTTTTTAPPASESSDDTLPVVLSHDADIQPIWTANCTNESCHDSDGPASGLDLQSPGVRDRLCANNSSTQTSIALVDCEGLDYEASWLWSKITGDGLEGVPGPGAPMPPGGMLTADEITTIEDWIAGGAMP